VFQRLKYMFFKFIFSIQKIILFLSYSYHRAAQLIGKQRNKVGWVVGVDETAAIIKYVSASLPSTFSVNFSKSPYYDFEYDFYYSGHNNLWGKIKRVFMGPLLLGRLATLADGFFYIWKSRFLITCIDEGEYEFTFLKKRSRKLVLFFVGSDIRSPKLAMMNADDRGDEVTANYYYLTKPSVLSHDYEKMIEKRALIAEKYADLIFTSRIDQISYFTRDTNKFLYFYPDSQFYRDKEKFDKNYVCKVVHAPSSPITKGTQLVRSAITRLRKENYNFQYVELQKSANTYVLKELRTAHIVLNEFYAHVPGVLGIEAMANYCALMTAADERIETDLPAGSNQAWLSTKSYEVYDNLKYLLDNPEQQIKYAESGYQWALENAAQSASGKKLQKLLDSIS
jgi:hypothetical protein